MLEYGKTRAGFEKTRYFQVNKDRSSSHSKIRNSFKGQTFVNPELGLLIRQLLQEKPVEEVYQISYQHFNNAELTLRQSCKAVEDPGRLPGHGG